MVVLFIPHRQRREFRAVNRDFASSLIQLNNTFYREHSASFSDTRQAPWPGWVRTMDIALGQLDVATIEHPVRVFDLACGNMRFENFAAGGALAAKGVDGANPSADASCPFEFYGVDSCQDLAIDAHGHALRIPNLHFQELDVLDALMKLNPAETPDVLFDAPLADISVCFGFMHHVPSCEYRVRVLDALVRQTRPGGIIAISFWEFMNDERMARKAVRAEARAELTPPFEGYDSAQFEAGDHLIGWQNDRHAYRYCHHFDDQQITDLVRQTRPGGIIAISFWEFMNDERMARKAVRAEARAELTPPFEGYDSAQFEAGDHLIGWQNDRHAYRYCHHFDDQQITDLVRGVRTFYKSGEVPVRELERFHADGRSGELNRYVILKRL